MDFQKFATTASSGIHVWYICTVDYEYNNSIKCFSSVLSEDELSRMKRFYFERDRHQFLLTRYLVRNMLSHYFPVMEPRDWRFSYSKLGKPFIDSKILGNSFSFNISHTRELIVCAVAPCRHVGIDIELPGLKQDVLGIADHYFSDREKEFLRRQSKLKKEKYFYRFWTLKEALLKAEGKGLSIGLDKISFDISRKPTVYLHVDPELGVDTTSYFVGQTNFSLGNNSFDYEMAVAVQNNHSTNQVGEVMALEFGSSGFRRAIPVLFNYTNQVDTAERHPFFRFRSA